MSWSLLLFSLEGKGRKEKERLDKFVGGMLFVFLDDIASTLDVCASFVLSVIKPNKHTEMSEKETERKRERNKSRDLLSFRLFYSLPSNYLEKSGFYRSVMFDVHCLLVSLFCFLCLFPSSFFSLSHGFILLCHTHSFFLQRKSVYTCLLFYLLTLMLPLLTLLLLMMLMMMEESRRRRSRAYSLSLSMHLISIASVFLFWWTIIYSFCSVRGMMIIIQVSPWVPNKKSWYKKCYLCSLFLYIV